MPPFTGSYGESFARETLPHARRRIFGANLVVPMPGFTCDAILFDLDGVLLDSNDVYERQWQEWARSRSVSYESIAAVHHGIPAAETIRRVAPHLDAEAEARLYNLAVAEKTDISGIRPYSGVREVLASLPEGRWAIVTSAIRAFALSLLAHLDLPVPKVFVASGDAARGKPAPDPYLKAAAGLGVDPKRSVVIEDAPAGVAAGRAAGARVIAVATTNPPSALRHADVIAETISALQIAAEADGCLIRWKNGEAPL